MTRKLKRISGANAKNGPKQKTRERKQKCTAIFARQRLQTQKREKYAKKAILFSACSAELRRYPPAPTTTTTPAPQALGVGATYGVRFPSGGEGGEEGEEAVEGGGEGSGLGPPLSLAFPQSFPLYDGKIH
jgi:hypothetical protein